MMKRTIAVAGSVLVGACVAAVPQPGGGGASGGSFIRGWTSLIPVTDEYQIAWTIPAASSPPGTVTAAAGDEIFRTQLLPERLFVAEAPVRAADGAILIPQGAQLVLMDWNAFMACSMTPGERDRICLLDENGDGAPDTYLPRDADGRSDMWFALNKRMTADRKPIQPAALREVAPDDLTRKPELIVRFSGGRGNGGIRLSADIDGEARFMLDCPPFDAASGTACVVPPIVVQPVRSDGERVRFSVARANRPAKVRFRVIYGTVSGGEVESARIFFE